MTEKAPMPNIKEGDRVRVVFTNGAELAAVVLKVTAYSFRLELKTKALQDVWLQEVWFSYFDPDIASIEVIEPVLPEWVTKPRQRAVGSYASWPATAIRDYESWLITWLDRDFAQQDVWLDDAELFALGFTPINESEGEPT